MSLATPDRDPTKWHPLLLHRWPLLAGTLLARIGKVMVNEGYRSDARQVWLYGQGRSPEDLQAVGLSPALARVGPRVTNAWSARLSAHGWTELGLPAAAALDLVPLGADDQPWTRDDDWAGLVAVVAELAPASGLRHFAKPGKAPWDAPHVQMAEWDDVTHRLVL